MAGVGDSWGTREELLHPRDSHGRFRSAWKMSATAIEKIVAALGKFNPKTFPSDDDAARYLDSHKTRIPPPKMGKILQNWAQVNADLRARKTDNPDVRSMDAAMAPLGEDLIVSRILGPEAFGLKPDTIAQLEEYTGKLVADRAYTAGNIGTPLTGTQPKITMVMSVPAGTRAVIPGGSNREIILDREQPFRITKVDPDGQGGFYVLAVATEKGAVGQKRTAKLFGKAPKLRQEKPQGVEAPQTEVPQVPVATSPILPVTGRRPGRPAAPPPAPRTERLAHPGIGTKQAAPAQPTPDTRTEAPTPTADGNEESKRDVRRAHRTPTPEGDEARAKQQAARTEADKQRETSERQHLADTMDKLGKDVGETVPGDEMTQRLLAIMVANLEAGRMTRAEAANRIRTSGLMSESAQHKKFLTRYADSLAPDKPNTERGLAFMTVGELREKAKAEGVTIPKTARTKTAIVAFLADALSDPDHSTPVPEESKKVEVKAPEPKVEVKAAVPESRAPSMREGKTNISRVRDGDTIYVRKDANGIYHPSAGKTGGEIVTVTGRDLVKMRAKRPYTQIRAKDGNGNEIVIAPGPSIQTFWRGEAIKQKAPAAAKPKSKTVDESTYHQQGLNVVSHRGKEVDPVGLEERMSAPRTSPDRVGLTMEEDTALNAYVKEGVASALNGGLRSDDPGAMTSVGRVDLKDVQRNMDSALAASEITDNTILWRGLFLTPEEIKKFTDGAVFTNKGYTSTSMIKTGADYVLAWRQHNQADKLKGRSPVLMKILAPKGTHGVVGDHSIREIIMARDLGLRLIRVETAPNGSLIYVMEPVQ